MTIDEKLEKRAKLINKLDKNLEEFAKLSCEINNLKNDNQTWRNVNLDFWNEICKHYDPNNLLNCYGDIFFIIERHDGWFVGKRVLWNFSLSDESYDITEFTYVDDDKDDIDYDIRVKRGE